MGIAGLALILLASEVPPETVWRVCSSIYALLYAIFFPRGMRRAASLESEDLNRVQMFTVGVSGGVVALLLIANAISIASFWPLATGLAYHTALALFNFYGLLQHAVSEGGAADRQRR